MKIVAFIPIKLNNERLPGKNTMMFDDGTPLIHLIQKTLLQLKSNNLVDDVYVYCSSDYIIPYLLPDVIYQKRSIVLDDNLTLGKEIYTSFANEVDSDIYILAHATSPFVSEATILE